MTQAVTNTFNNIEQILNDTKDLQKSVGQKTIGMDSKSTDFSKVFDKTLSKSDNQPTNKPLNPTKNTNLLDSDTKSANKDSNIQDTFDDNNIEQDDILNIVNKENTDSSLKDETETNDSNIWVDFQGIIKQFAQEANIENSLDLSLAKDIEETISDLQEAVEAVEEVIDESGEEIVTEIINPEISTEALVPELNNNTKNDETFVEDSEQQIETNKTPEQSKQGIFEQLITYNNSTNEQKALEIDMSKTEEVPTETSDSIDFNQSEVIEFAESIVDDAIANKSTNVNNAEIDLESLIDEEIVKDLKIESLSAEMNTSSDGSMMQQQAPEELAIKTIINRDVETFELKTDSTQNLQSQPQVQTKSTEINSSRILEQIAKQMNGLQNGSKVNVVLNPESLGKVNIQLLNTKDGLTAQFVVTTQEARDLLTKGLEGLKETLTSHGVGVDNISVKIAEGQKSEYNQDWTEQEGSRGGNKGQQQQNREEKEKGLFEKMMAQTTENENGNV